MPERCSRRLLLKIGALAIPIVTATGVALANAEKREVQQFPWTYYILKIVTAEDGTNFALTVAYRSSDALRSDQTEVVIPSRSSLIRQKSVVLNTVDKLYQDTPNFNPTKINEGLNGTIHTAIHKLGKGKEKFLKLTALPISPKDIFVNPKNPNHVTVLGTQEFSSDSSNRYRYGHILFLSRDGGKTFSDPKIMTLGDNYFSLSTSSIDGFFGFYRTRLNGITEHRVIDLNSGVAKPIKNLTENLGNDFMINTQFEKVGNYYQAYGLRYDYKTSNYITIKVLYLPQLEVFVTPDLLMQGEDNIYRTIFKAEKTNLFSPKTSTLIYKDLYSRFKDEKTEWVDKIVLANPENSQSYYVYPENFFPNINPDSVFSLNAIPSDELGGIFFHTFTFDPKNFSSEDQIVFIKYEDIRSFDKSKFKIITTSNSRDTKAGYFSDIFTFKRDNSVYLGLIVNDKVLYQNMDSKDVVGWKTINIDKFQQHLPLIS